MPAKDEAEAVAVLLPPPEAARVAIERWEAGEAIVPLDPSGPAPELRRSLDSLRPTALIDADVAETVRVEIALERGLIRVAAIHGRFPDAV
jgi:hypothetical protein